MRAKHILSGKETKVGIAMKALCAGDLSGGPRGSGQDKGSCCIREQTVVAKL